MSQESTRRDFLSAGLAGMGLAASVHSVGVLSSRSADKPALLGGTPVRTQPFPSWPLISDQDEKNWEAVLRHKEWCRQGAHSSYATRFEEAWKDMAGAKYCLATSSGTTALFSSLSALDVGPGDEVLVPPYTFVATINVVLLRHALPVFVDTDRETFQMDPAKIETAITPQTRCILPVHLGGSAANMDKILEVARNHKLQVLEDACQAHLAEWRHQKVGTLGDLGCFSFQASKNLNSGEGGAIFSNHKALIERCMSFHNNGRGVDANGYVGTRYVMNGSNHRITEFQGALLMAQASRLEAQSQTRTENATYLTEQLKKIQGIAPARMYAGCTRNAYHLYMLRYDKDHFGGLPRARFLEALKAEGIPCSEGYTPLNREPLIEASLKSRAYKKIYTEQEISKYRERNHCPENDELCKEAVWFFQTMLLGSKQDMDQIAEAVRKIQRNAGELAHM